LRQQKVILIKKDENRNFRKFSEIWEIKSIQVKVRTKVKIKLNSVSIQSADRRVLFRLGAILSDGDIVEQSL